MEAHEKAGRKVLFAFEEAIGFACGACLRFQRCLSHLHQAARQAARHLLLLIAATVLLCRSPRPRQGRRLRRGSVR